MVAKLTDYAVANVIELFVQTFVILQMTPFLDKRLMTWLYNPLLLCWYDVCLKDC